MIRIYQIYFIKSNNLLALLVVISVTSSIVVSFINIFVRTVFEKMSTDER